MEKIIVFLADGFEEMEAIVPIDVWRRAGFNVITISISNDKVVTGSHNIPVFADSLFDESLCSDAKLIFLPGGMPGSSNLDKHPGVRKVIRDSYSQGKYLSAICAAPIVLGHNNLLKGKKATCFPGYEKELTEAIVTGNSVEIDGKIITGKGAGVALNFALEIVALFKGKSFSEELAAKLQVI